MKNIVLPLKQHVGAPCKAIVSEGEYVKRGQLIAVPGGLGANIHASYSGTITKVTDTDIRLQMMFRISRHMCLFLNFRRI